jgi:excisionase family DNA binding protein
MSQLLSVKQVSDVLGMRVSTVRAWLSKRRLPRVNCGRSVRIPANAVTDFIERNTIPARAPNEKESGSST